MNKSDGKQKLRATGRRDTLTGLYNYEYFNKQAELFDTVSKLPLSIIICDVNGLDLINDILGPARRDALLVEAAAFITSCVRRGDIVAKGENGRFLILLPQTSGAMARIIIDRIQSACRERQSAAGGELMCYAISIGCATKENEQEDIFGILNSAAQDMLAKKLLEQKSFYDATLRLIKKALFQKSHETEQHGERLVRQSRMLGEALGLSEEELVKLEMLAMLHDIGKVGIHKAILAKPGPLDDEEWNEIKKHPVMGYKIAKAVPQLSGIAQGILSHHERWDGNGYPSGLKREGIPLMSRIIAVVDTFDALTSKRCYREAVSVNEALREIERCAGTQFDPYIAEVFIRLKRGRQTYNKENKSIYGSEQTEGSGERRL